MTGRTAIPPFACPKCGAVGDVKLVLPPSDQAIAEAKGWIGYFANWPDPDIAGSTRHYDYLLAEREKGEHLSCSCPRCNYKWEETPLDQRNDSSLVAPLIYDNLSTAHERTTP